MLALAVVMASINLTAHAQSKGDQALLDALVRKGVLTDKEATEISAETANQADVQPWPEDPGRRLGERAEVQRRSSNPESMG